MAEIPIIVSDDEIIVAGNVDEIELRVDVGAEGDRGAIFFTGDGEPGDIPDIGSQSWGNVTQYRIGDLYLQTNTVEGDIWNYKNFPGGPAWVKVFKLSPSG